MKKLFLSLVSFGLLSVMSQAATTVVYSVGDTATAQSWASSSIHSTLVMDDVITINATHAATASVTNGTYSNSQWYAYKADNNGEFSINAAEGYRIYTIAVKNNPQKSSMLVEKTSQQEVNKDEAPFLVNAPSVTLNVINGTSGNICARITKFTVVYDALPTAASLDDMTLQVGQRFQMQVNVTPATIFNQATWTTSAPAIVDIDANGMIDVKAEGSATITATTINGKVATCTVTAVAASKDITFTEDYATLAEQVDWKNSNTEYTGAMGQLFRVRNYRFSDATDLTTGVDGVELQYTVNTKTINFIAYANAQQEGGVKAVAFQWRAVDGTKPVMFDVDSTQNKTTMNLVSLPANGGYEKVQNFAKEINFERNTQLRIRLADANSSNIVFGPVTITPYLLYQQKKDTVTTPIQSYDCTAASLLINNVDGTVNYTILDDTSEAASISDGILDLSAIEQECDITVQAAWKSVKTTFKLHINEGVGTRVDDAQAAIKCTKVLKDGQIIILRGAERFTLLGTEF